LKHFVTARQQSGAVDAPLPALPDFSAFVFKSMSTMPPELLFPVIDLFRVALIDPRLSGYFAQDSSRTVLAILTQVSGLGESCPHTLRIVTVQMACNLFTSSMFPPKLLSDSNLLIPLLHLVTTSLLDTDHSPVRVSAASLAFNIAAANHSRRLSEEEDLLPESSQVELAAGLLEAIGKERESKEGLSGLLLAVGLIKYAAPKGGEVDDLCEAIGAKDIVAEAKGAFEDLNELAKEVELVMK